MNMGLKPFSLNKEGRLELAFEPILPSWLFTSKAKGLFAARTYSFKLFAKILVTYHNPKLKDTFGPQGVKAQKIVLSYPDRQVIELAGGVLSEVNAMEVREGKLKSIDVYLN